MEIGQPQILNPVGKEDVCVRQILRCYLAGSIYAVPQLLDALSIYVEPMVRLFIPKATATGRPT